MSSQVRIQTTHRSIVSSRQSRLLATSALAIAALTALSVGGGSKAFAASSGFENIGTIGGSTAYAYGVSADGTVVIGNGLDGGGQQHAFRWSSSGGMQDIGTLGGVYSIAWAVSGDGTTVVGRAYTASSDEHAFIWTAAGGMVDLGTLGGPVSEALGVNNDGTVVVGKSLIGGSYHAFLWTGNVMSDMGTLTGSDSAAYGVSGDGSVVVGYGSLSSGDSHAFRWTSSGGMADLGTLTGGTDSFAYGVSSDGAAVVGESTVGGVNRAFRWTSADGMTDLGTLGTVSTAWAANADGSVVVGTSFTGTANRGFRWTDATGMVSVEDWLRSKGVTIATDTTATARGVSADGNVVVGATAGGTAYIARYVPGGTSGIIDTAQYSQTLAAKPTAQVGLNYAGTTMNGAHGEPMRNLLAVGRQSFGVTADTGYDNSSSAEGGIAIGDLSYGIGIEGGATARFAFGGLYTRQDLTSGGNFMQSGFYVAPEVTLPVAGNVYATVGGYYAPGKLDINRGYLNGSANDTSRGKTDIDTWAAKLRFDWLNAASIEDTKLTPYASLTYAAAHMDGYTETGGSFPSQFNAVDDHSTVARIGLDSVTAVSDHVRLLGKAEAAYRFEKETADISGQIVGLSSFNLSGRSIDQFWLRGAIGVEFDAGGGTASLSLNASTEGDDPTVWLKSGWKVTF